MEFIRQPLETTSSYSPTLDMWSASKLGDCLEELYRYPTYFGIDYVDIGVPEIRGELIEANGSIEENGEKFRYISQETARRFPKVRLETEDFVMSVRGTIGKIAIVPERLRGAVITANLIMMRFNRELIYPGWARHFLLSEAFQSALDLATSATTIKTVQVPRLLGIAFLKPPLEEQRRIAEILDTVDDAVQKTEALIDKLKAMKQGLLHDLLSRGIDENGKLRDPQTHPEQFKESPIGRIPAIWDISQLGSLSEFITSGSRGWASYFSTQGAIFLRITNLTRDHVNMRFNDVQHVSPPPGGSEGKRTKVSEGDLLISITADLGIIGVIPTGFGEAYINQHIALVRLDRNVANPRWIANYLAFGPPQEQFRRLNDQGAKAGMNLPTVGTIMVAKPAIEEQGRIASVIDAHEAKIHKEQQYLNKLKLQKKGLMHDLLTGKVRVRVPEGQARC